MVPIRLLTMLVLFAPAAPPSAIPDFTVDTVEGPLPAGPLTSLTDDFSLVLGGPKPAKVAGKDLVGLRHTSLPLPAQVRNNFLLLTNGDRLPLDVKSLPRLDRDRLYCVPAAPLRTRDEIGLSVNYASILWLEDSVGLVDPVVFLTRLDKEARPRDVLLLRNGDRIEGALRSLNSKDGARLDVAGDNRLVPWSQLAGIAFNTELRARPRSKGPYAHLVLARGARLGVTQLRLDDGHTTLTGKLLTGGLVEVPLAELRALDIRQGPAVYLSDLTPKSYRHTPFLGVTWPLGNDVSAAGRPLVLGPHTFDKGLGMHGQSETIFDLAGKYRWFETTVGLDRHTGRLGRVRLRVLVDGKEQDLGAGGLRTGRDEPTTLRIDVRQAKELSLIVGFAGYADVASHVNWANARLLK
jgi:hypothetical protein